MAHTCIVIPCYNEARRLDVPALESLADAELRLLLVDDGSTDGTGPILERLVAGGDGRIGLLTLPRNRGKAEAVRQGLLEAMRQEPAIVGYADADLATPVDELRRLAGELRRREAAVLLGSRVRLLGRHIERRALRHYLGRVFATFASLVLDLPVYDTQCGAKFLRAGPPLQAALERPFHSRWAFDVELIGRLLAGAPGVPPLPREAFVEVPLLRWCDVPGSKVSWPGALRAGLELFTIWAHLRRRRRAAMH